MKKARNGFIKALPYLCLVGVIVLGLMTIIGTGGGGGGGDGSTTDTTALTAGGWTGSAGFGELSFIVNSTSTGITEISYAFSDFLCGIATYNGTITVKTTTPWSITDSQFTIERTFSPDFEMTLIGTFDETGMNASGTWEAVSDGTTCSGTWDASPIATINGTLTLPAEANGKEYWVLIDNDTDGDNGYVNATVGTCGSGTTVDYTINNVNAGAYYVYAGVRIVSGHDSPPQSGDYIGFYGTGSDPPDEANAVVPSSGTVTFDIILSVY